MRYLALLLALLIPVVALSAPLTRGPDNVSKADQYSRSCSPFQLFGFSASSTNAESLIDDTGAKVLMRWETQFEVTCRGASSAYALVCLHQEPDDWGGYEAAYNDTVQPNMENSCGDGCGEITDDSATGITGHAPCVLVQDGMSKYVRVSRGPWTGSVDVPTERRGRCDTVGSGYQLGAPCNADAECGSGGDCTLDTRGPDGVFVGVSVSSTSLTCQVEVCI